MFGIESNKNVEFSSVFTVEDGKYVEIGSLFGVENGKYVELLCSGKRLVATSGTYSYISTDNGVTWIKSSTEMPSSLVKQGAASNGNIVVAEAISSSQSSFYPLAYTKDGLNWTTITSVFALSSHASARTVYIPELSLFFHILDKSEQYNHSVQVYKSADGINWSHYTTIEGLYTGRRLNYDKSRNRFIITTMSYTSSADQTVYYSIKSISLGSITEGGVSTYYWNVETNSSAYMYSSEVAVNETGLAVTIKSDKGNSYAYPMYKPTGSTTWTALTTSLFRYASLYAGDLVYGNGRFVLVSGDYYGNSFYSTNGTSWTKSTGIDGSLEYGSLIFDGEQFLCKGIAAGCVYKSTDGISWSKITIPNATGNGSISYLM